MSLTMLICDDDPVARQVMMGLAKQAGYDVISEVDLAVQALDLATHYKPDVLVMDVAMPGLSGLEAAPIVHDSSPDTLIVLVSAFELDEDEARQAGAHSIVDKSDFGELAKVLESIAGNSAART